jgi:hypothetical protein
MQIYKAHVKTNEKIRQIFISYGQDCNVPFAACLPIDWYTRMRSAKKCRWFVDLALKTIEREKPEIVFLHYMQVPGE